MQMPLCFYIQNIAIITPPKMAHFGVRDAKVQRSSDWGIWEMNGEKSSRSWIVSNMHQGKTINALSQKESLDWGSMRMVLAHEEIRFKSHSNPMENPLIPTWRCKEIACPQLSLMRDTGAVPEAP